MSKLSMIHVSLPQDKYEIFAEHAKILGIKINEYARRILISSVELKEYAPPSSQEPKKYDGGVSRALKSAYPKDGE